MSVFDGMPNQPVTMGKDELLRVLEDIKQLVMLGDSMEGTLSYEWGDEAHQYRVGGFIRTGNTRGQGGAIVIWKTSS